MRLRRLSLLMLASATVFLICGLTFLEPRLRGWIFLIYWLACFGLATLAILAALIDLSLIRRQARQVRQVMRQQVFSGAAPRAGAPSPPAKPPPAAGP